MTADRVDSLAFKLDVSAERSQDAFAELLSRYRGQPLADVRALLGGQDDLRLEIEDGQAELVFNADLFKRSTIERIVGHLRRLLETGGSILTDTESHWLAQVSRGPAQARPPIPMHREFEARAVESPGAIAVRHRDEALTFRELNERANRLARDLVATGAGAGTRVVVCLEPGLEIAVALLAVLKAGATYVPLDPTYPAPRVHAILEDTTPRRILTQSWLAARLPFEGFERIELDHADAHRERLSGANLEAEVPLTSIAYVYYTSGSTGKPKGVLATQANLIAYILSARERYAIGKHDVMPAIARFSFSISMFELLSPLAAGGTLIVLDRDHVVDVSRMAATLREVTFFHAGPSLLKKLLPQIRAEAHGDYRAYAGVRHASSGGDLIAPELLESLKEIFVNAEVFAIYGSSEIACMGTTYPVPRDRTIARTYVGKPFANVTVKVLDAELKPVPVGVVGEIHFGGDGVVDGYLNRPELTAEKFVHLDGERLYRTGDLGRLSDEGWVEILGRNDFQVKIRGMRVETGDVEHALRRAPGVRDGVVMAGEGTDGEKILVAYVVLENATESTAAVRRSLAECLPDYMVPAKFITLAALPLNHNLKLDRHALPPVAQAIAEMAPGLHDPETESEQVLAGIWTRLLKVDRVAREHNFFELGGDSLAATEFIAEAKARLGVVFEGMDVLRETLVVLAGICDQGRGQTPLKVADDRVASPAALEIFHFGRGQDLYGVLHPALDGGAETAVLICPPVGQEHARAHFALMRLAERLAARGSATMRFDYFGSGDSLGEDGEGSCRRWRDDIIEAHAELRRRTGARRIVGIGVRLGATLLWSAQDQAPFAKLVLWDPVDDGAAFLARQSELQQRFLAGARDVRSIWSSARVTDAGINLLGTTFSPAAARELKGLAIDGTERGLPVRRLRTECGWEDLARLGENLAEAGVVRALTGLMEDAS